MLAARAAAVTAAVALAGLLALPPAAAAAPSYAAPSGAWAQFQSDLNGAEGLATGRGVTVALLSTGADTSGFGGRVSNGPDYIAKPTIALTHTLGTLTAGLILGVPGAVRGVAPDARVLALRIQPDFYEQGAAAFFSGQDPVNIQAVDGQAIRYAVSRGAQVIIIDSVSYQSASPELLSAVSYALSRNVVIASVTIGSADKQNWRYGYPTGIPGVIGVSTLMLPGGPAPFSPSVTEANNSVLIAGPADTMLASSTGWELDDFGTAGALVAATIALIKERYPHLSPALVGRAMAMSARDHPKGGYAPSVGFGVLDPYDAILDAGKLAAVTTTAQSGPGVVAAGANFGGGPPGVISALPPVGPVAEVYWTLMGLGVLLLVAAVVLAVRRPHRVPRAARPHRARRAGRARHRHGRHPPPGPQYSGPPYPGRQYPGPQYPGEQHPGPPYLGPQHPGQPPARPWYPGPPSVGSPYPRPQYPGPPYPAPQYPGPPSGSPYPGPPYPGPPPGGSPYPGSQLPG